ncbi:MAG: sigma-54 dependent transcriptional regulator [candidate division KSB1 bacterium]|nr:sigma-54 dependent transcriptional regulator [candidate division KSB1 bacterium]MDZ7303745.1 sigma-54 dependent transcriptional regulator [candidate division KSB1 bacterium]MDZ7313118.1 sigma-54 dependent transcriptional regulator [candidate division KSB1 bacterium]
MWKYQILIVDDELLVRNSLRRLLSHHQWNVATVASGAEARRFLAEHPVDLAIVDYKLGDVNGLEVIEYIRESCPGSITIMLTAYGNIPLAVEAIRKGAYDFLQKESDPQLIRHVVEKALEKVRLRKEVELLQQERLLRATQTAIIKESPAMKQVLAAAKEYARTDTTVLLEGETGTGKSLIAEYIHFSGPRKDGPFVTINCGAIPKELIESELFGYEKGAFTGANHHGKMGLIERADGGTLFLDEIGDLALELQSKLLCVLEKGEFLSVGAVEPTKVNVRFIAATNANLEQRLASQQFRRDLYYRLNVANIKIPPLRDRKEDIVPLAKHFVHQLNQKLGKSVSHLSPAAENRLLSYPWPGNIRELHNAIERVMLLKKNEIIDAPDLYFLTGAEWNESNKNLCRVEIDFSTCPNALHEVTRQVVLRAWEVSEHNQTNAARLLGVPRTTLQSYLQKYNLL